MNGIKTSTVWLGTITLAVALAVLSCTHSNNRPPDEAFSCMGFPVLEPNLPFDVDLPTHPNVQCFAWQEFIALNWPAVDGRAGEPDRMRLAGTWGDPGTTSPTVWETYKEAHEIFLPGAAVPASWDRRDLLRSFAGELQVESMARGMARFEAPETLSDNPQDSLSERVAARLPVALGLQVLRLRTKVSPRLSATQQAFGGTLTGQNGKLTYYSIYVNRQAFDYIVDNRLYDAAEQLGTPIDFPMGRTGLGADPAQEGAIVVKSAWLDLTGYTTAERRRFHSLEACVVEGDACRWVTVGLVGLHILQKTETFPQWTWATFEHVDNAPDREEIRQGTLAAKYNYHDPSCPPSTCLHNARTTPPEPNQVVRVTPIDDETRKLNAEVHRRIRGANRDSVWQNYQLVDVQWPEAGHVIRSTADVPIAAGAPRPTSLANTTLETFVQRRTCIDCHRQFATIADSGGASHRQNADYTFLLGLARE